jgi:hypothetical protein
LSFPLFYLGFFLARPFLFFRDDLLFISFPSSLREMELRRRRKEDARFATESKIADMKRRAKDAESWKKRKESLVQKALPFCVGLAMLSAAGVYFFATQSGAASGLGK